MALPLFMVTTRLLSLHGSAKVGVVFIFSLSIIDISFDIVRTVHSLSEDLSYNTNLLAVWTFLEPTIAIMICALPCYKGVLSRSRSKSSTSRHTSQNATWPSFVPVEMDHGSTYSLQSRSRAADPV